MSKNQNESKPEDVEEPGDEGLDETTCSPSSDVRRCGEVTISRNGYVEELERKLREALKDAENAKSYKRVLKNENARLRRMLNLPENAQAMASADARLTPKETTL